MSFAFLRDLVTGTINDARTRGPLAALRDTVALAAIVVGYVIATPRYRTSLDHELN